MIKNFIIPSKNYRSPYYSEINYDQDKIDSIINSSNYFSRFFFNDKNQNDIFDNSKINLKNKKEADYIQNFYNSLDHEKIKGYSPLEKAIFLQKFLDKTESDDYNKVIENINAYDSIKESDKYFASIDDINFEESIDKFFDLSFLNLLKLKNKINFIFNSSNRFGISKKIKGDKKVKNKRMEYSDIPVLSTKIIYDDFDYKFITKSYSVDERYSLEAKKFIDIILYDFSGSMSSYDKRNIAKAFLLSYLENIYNGKSKLCFCYFIKDIIKVKFIDSKEKGKNLFEAFIKEIPNGGLTDLDESLNTLDEIIKSNSFFDLMDSNIPSLTILNDGQDNVDSNKNYNLKINAFSIEKENLELEKLCKKHSGVFIKKI